MSGEQWSAGERSTTTSISHYQSNDMTDDCSNDDLLLSTTGCDVTDNPLMQQNSAPVDLVASCSTHAQHNHSPTSASAFARDVNASPPQQYSHGLYAVTSSCTKLTSLIFHFGPLFLFQLAKPSVARDSD